MKEARVISRRGRMTPNGRKRIDQIRAGRKGKGKVLFTVIVSPWEGKSEAEASEMIDAAAERMGVSLQNDQYYN